MTARTPEGFVRPESLPSKLGHAREHLPERFARRLEPGTNGDERHFGLLFLFADPNAESHPLNSEAAKDLMQSTRRSAANVRKAMMGGSINGVRFTKVM